VYIRTLFQHDKVMCYVLTLAVLSGKQLVLFTTEDEFGLMVGPEKW
jgi:hypothetical protein